MKASHSPGLISFLVTIALLVGQLSFTRPYFLVSDDILKILLVKGIGVNSNPTPYFVQSNVLLGFFFIKIFSWFPHFPAYTWFLCLVQFFSEWSLLWVLLLTGPAWWRTALFILTCLGYQFLFFTYLQFTITALLAAGMGFLLFHFAGEKAFHDRRFSLLTFSGSLFFVAGLIRLDSLGLVLLAAVPLWMLRAQRSGVKIFFGENWKFLAVTAFLVIAPVGFNFAWFQGHGEWKDHESFIEEVQKLLVYQGPDYSSQNKPLFDSVGWSENDYWLFRNWYFLDADKFSLSNIRKLRDQLPLFNPGQKIGSFQSLSDLLFSPWDGRMALCFLVLLFFCRGKAGFLAVQFLWINLIFLFLLYFLKATDRLTLPLLAFLINLAVFYAQVPSFQLSARRPRKEILLAWGGIALLGGGGLLAVPALVSNHAENLERRKIEARVREDLRLLNPTDRQLYDMWDFPFELIGAFDDLECFRPFHLFTHFAIQRSPATLETLQKFGVGDILRDAVDNPNILVICNQEQGRHYYVYMRERYGRTIFAQKVLDGGVFKVFTIHSRKGS